MLTNLVQASTTFSFRRPCNISRADDFPTEGLCLFLFGRPELIVLIQDHPELLTPVDYNDIRSLTTQIHEKISTGTIDSPSWDLVRTGKLAARIYAPLGTRMSLGDHVRVARAFLDAFKATEDTPGTHDNTKTNEGDELSKHIQLRQDLKVKKHSPFRETPL